MTTLINDSIDLVTMQVKLVSNISSTTKDVTDKEVTDEEVEAAQLAKFRFAHNKKEHQEYKSIGAALQTQTKDHLGYYYNPLRNPDGSYNFQVGIVLGKNKAAFEQAIRDVHTTPMFKGKAKDWTIDSFNKNKYGVRVLVSPPRFTSIADDQSALVKDAVLASVETVGKFVEAVATGDNKDIINAGHHLLHHSGMLAPELKDSVRDILRTVNRKKNKHVDEVSREEQLDKLAQELPDHMADLAVVAKKHTAGRNMLAPVPENQPDVLAAIAAEAGVELPETLDAGVLPETTVEHAPQPVGEPVTEEPKVEEPTLVDDFFGSLPVADVATDELFAD